MPKPLKSIRFKMSVLAALLLGTILIFYSFYLYLQLRDALYSNLDAELQVKTHELGKSIKAFQRTRSPAGDIHYAAFKVLQFDVNLEESDSLALADRQWIRLIDRYKLDEDFVSVLSLDGDILATTENMPNEVRDELAGKFPDARRISSNWGDLIYEGNKYRVIQVTAFARDEPHYIIQIATPMTAIYELLHERLWGIAVSIPVIVLLFGLVGFLLANGMLKPVRTIAETAERITHENLSRRVRIDKVDSEMMFLVNAFNKMTERLEGSFKHMAEMTSHIAHELKTPLAIIRGESQVLLRKKDPSPEKYRSVLASNLAETDRILRVIEDLLTITNASYEKEIFSFEKVDLKKVLIDVCDKSQILSEAKDIKIELDLPGGDILINGKKGHLRRLFLNLLDNAIKYSSGGSQIRVSAELRKNGVTVRVSDQGAGIDEKDLSRIFERAFFKKDKMNSANEFSVSAGLGLYLCSAIARAHQGSINVKSALGEGSTFSVYFPLIDKKL